MQISVPNPPRDYAAQLSELSSRARLPGRGAHRRWHVAATEIDYNQAVPVIQHATDFDTVAASAEGRSKWQDRWWLDRLVLGCS